MTFLNYKMTTVSLPKWYIANKYLEGSPKKTLEDVYEWHSTRTEQQKLEEYGLLYHNVGPAAAARFAVYANINGLLQLVDKDTPPPIFTSGFLTDNFPAKRLRSRLSKKYMSLSSEEKKFFIAWFSIERSKFMSSEQRIEEQRFLFAKDENLYKDVLAHMLALPPLEDDEYQLPVYRVYYEHIQKVEPSIVFQKWLAAVKIDERENKKIRLFNKKTKGMRNKKSASYDLSKAYFDANILTLLPLFESIYIVPENKEKEREKDTRMLSNVLTAMGANEGQSSDRSWGKDNDAIKQLKRTRDSLNDALDFKWAMSRRNTTGALYDFGPELLHYDKNIGPLHNHYITDTVYHKNKSYKKPEKPKFSLPGYYYKS